MGNLTCSRHSYKMYCFLRGWLRRNADHLTGLQRRPEASKAEGHRGGVAPDMERLGDGERLRIDADHAVVPRRLVLPNGRGAGPDRAGPDRRVDGAGGQRYDAPDGG